MMNIYQNAINGAYAEIISPNLEHTLVANPIIPNMLINSINQPNERDTITASIARDSQS